MENENKKNGLLQFMSKHKIISVLIVLLVLLVLFRIGASVADRFSPAETEDTTVTVKTTIADYEDISSTAPLTGRILPEEEVAIVPLASGKVTSVNVKVGDYVSAGTILFEIDKSQVSGSYNQAKAAYDLAATTYSNMSTLYNAGAISKSTYDQAYVSYVSAEENFKTAAEMYANYSVTTPISGYVTSVSVDVGSVAGQTMAASVANTDSLVIDTTVSEYLSTNLKKGDEVQIYVASLGDKAYKGTISEISPAPAYGTLTYPITIAVDDGSADIKAGMFAEIQVKDRETKNALCVPSDAVITKSGRNVVVVLDDENKPTYVNVTTGIDNGEKAEILSGLKKGDLIVISGQQFVTEGVPVKVSNEDVSLIDKSGKK